VYLASASGAYFKALICSPHDNGSVFVVVVVVVVICLFVVFLNTPDH